MLALFFSIRRFVGWGILVGLLAGCAHWDSRQATDWPDDVPPRAHFEASYEQDSTNQEVQTKAEYLEWVKRFYHGWKFYGQGWNDLAPEVLAEIEDPEERQELEQLIRELGQDIAAEWAKQSKLNRIKSRHLAIWGNALRDAMVEGQEREILLQIARDVDRLLDRRLVSQDITYSRYYPEEDDDVFR